MVYIFKIQIKDIKKPPVWRRIAVPSNYTFSRFHEVIQAAFGWENYHQYEFSLKGYGSDYSICLPLDPDFDFFGRETRDSEKTKLSTIFKEKGQKFVYIYDFGDDWIHSILLEDILDSKVLKAELMAGKGMCPPEDVGGIWGYAYFLEALSDPNHEEHSTLREWIGLGKDEMWDTAIGADALLDLAEEVRRV